MIDIICTLLNLFGAEEGGNAVVYGALILIIGPIAGYAGARTLNRRLIGNQFSLGTRVWVCRV